MYCTPGASGRRSVLTMMAPQVLLQTTMWIHHHCKDLKYIFSSQGMLGRIGLTMLILADSGIHLNK